MGRLGRVISGLSFAICGAFHIFISPRKILGQYLSGKAKLLMDVGEVVDGNDSNQDDRQLNQAALFAFLFGELSFPGGKIA